MKTNPSDDLRPEYEIEDMGKGVRGKYYKEYQKKTNLILLSPDVAQVFPDDESVNNALRSLIDLAQKSTNLKGVHQAVPKNKKSG